MDFVPCPVCNTIAEVQDRLRKDPKGAITHVTVACVAGHWTMLPMIEEQRRTPSDSRG